MKGLIAIVKMIAGRFWPYHPELMAILDKLARDDLANGTDAVFVGRKINADQQHPCHDYAPAMRLANRTSPLPQEVSKRPNRSKAPLSLARNVNSVSDRSTPMR